MLEFERIEKAESQKKYLAVMEWTTCSKNMADHKSFGETRRDYLGSANWILSHDKVQNWIGNTTPVSSILWMNGIPGAGLSLSFVSRDIKS